MAKKTEKNSNLDDPFEIEDVDPDDIDKILTGIDFDKINKEKKKESFLKCL